ncbi:group I truncated hemoglobin [Janthinobacterium agaricidamnosum]|uniref:Bacterial-like globin family protein n=1 Tax=Janthinobacterium agaricidamnosum NBRC 102515 = DSM 9628 TaxID=1349767 RepID=W0VDR2_9BURK|nr:group 1 truncated hemoglobin [Janthinobacterium agaricidamnosum]CDG86061.1 bacterial-like globin family protein [Janthinobacterium agaricidamnosum NBRC 102515 = DSM 9628]
MKTPHKMMAAGLLLASALASAQTPYTEDSTYRGLGGKEGIAQIVKTFMPLILSDPRIKESFVDFDMEQLAERLAEQICEFSGGPCTYTGKYKERDMESVHIDLKITNAQFNALTEDLQLAMEQHKIPSSVQNKLLAKLAPMQRAIVTK